MSQKNILIFTATYNEAENINEFVNKVLSTSDSYDLLVVDDNSPDGTGKLLDAVDSQRLITIHRKGKLGLGTAHIAGMEYAIEHGYRTLVTMDSDFSHDPSEIPLLISKLQSDSCAMVIGSRFAPGGKSDYTGLRKFISQCANTLASILLRLGLSEHTTSFRAFDIGELKKFNLDLIKSSGYAFFFEFVFFFSRSGLKIGEAPIYFRDRQAGESKISKKEILNGIKHLMKLSLFGKSRYPLR